MLIRFRVHSIVILGAITDPSPRGSGPADPPHLTALVLSRSQNSPYKETDPLVPYSQAEQHHKLPPHTYGLTHTDVQCL